MSSRELPFEVRVLGEVLVELGVVHHHVADGFGEHPIQLEARVLLVALLDRVLVRLVGGDRGRELLGQHLADFVLVFPVDVAVALVERFQDHAQQLELECFCTGVMPTTAGSIVASSSSSRIAMVSCFWVR